MRSGILGGVGRAIVKYIRWVWGSGPLMGESSREDTIPLNRKNGTMGGAQKNIIIIIIHMVYNILLPYASGGTYSTRPIAAAKKSAEAHANYHGELQFGLFTPRVSRKNCVKEKGRRNRSSSSQIGGVLKYLKQQRGCMGA